MSLQKASLDEIRKAGSRICRDYLTGKWKEVNAEDLIVKRISGGLSNFLYYISLPNEENEKISTTTTPTLSAINHESLQIDNVLEDNFDHFNFEQTEPKEVLLRVYGQTHGGDALENVITESVVFTLLSERNFGPKLYGIFPGGRLEQYIPARALYTKELAIPYISKKIAEKMGEIHSLEIPMSKNPDWLWNCTWRWLNSSTNILQNEDIKGNNTHIEFVHNFDFTKEIDWLREIISSQHFPVLFCHNDMQEGNILLRQKLDANKNICDGNSNDFEDECPDLIIIDFEYCAYNYRGFDLANHFLEWCFDYSNPSGPLFSYNKEQYPSKEQRRAFIHCYLQKLNESGEKVHLITEDEIEKVDFEVKVFSMFSHLFWSLWSIVNATSNIEFGYWEYAYTRLTEFLRLKQDFLELNRSS